jgi:Domain of unknown function (DUF4386)
VRTRARTLVGLRCTVASLTRAGSARERGQVVDALRKPGRIAGLWFIGTIIFSIPATLLYDPVLSDADYILGDGREARISLGALLEIFLAIANIATAVVFFPVLRRVNEAVALGYVTLRTIESAIILLGLISLLSVVTLRDDFAGAGADSATLDIVGQTLVAFHDWTSLLGPQLCAGFGNGILLGYLMYRSGLVPRRMALLGLIGGPLAFLGGVFVLFGAFEQPSAPLAAFTAIEVVWEVSLAIYLTVKGYRPSPLLAGTRSA